MFPGLPKEMQLIIREFGREAIDKEKREIKQRYSKQKAGVAYSPYLRNAMLRHYHQLLEKVKPFAPLVKWYNTKQLNGNKHFSTAPCKFSSFMPHLKFEVVKKGERLELITLIDINGTEYKYKTFARLHYLLESNNEFFILSYRDYQKLEWLKEEKPEQYATRPAELAQHILAELEKDYMPASQRNMYENIKVQIRNSLFLDIKIQGFAKSKLAVIQGILKLRQICNSPFLLPENERSC